MTLIHLHELGVHKLDLFVSRPSYFLHCKSIMVAHSSCCAGSTTDFQSRCEDTGFIKSVSGKQTAVERTRSRGRCHPDRQRGTGVRGWGQEASAAPSRALQQHGNAWKKKTITTLLCSEQTAPSWCFAQRAQ